MRELLITRPDDWHVHLRDGAVLAVSELTPLCSGEQMA